MTDREKVIKDLEDIAEFFEKMTIIETRCAELKEDAENAIKLLEEQPDVVKCEDCKHCVWATKTRMSDCGKTGLFIKPGFYCAFGERKNLCKNCKAEIRPGYKYCPECGSKVV